MQTSTDPGQSRGTSPPFVTPASLARTSEDTAFVKTDAESQQAIWKKFKSWCLESSPLSSEETAHLPKDYICVNCHIPFYLQQGATCGLLALKMAAQFILPDSCKSSSALLETARGLGVSRSGEMFSGEDMVRLARACYPGLEAACWNKPWNSEFLNKLIRSVQRGWPVMVPYDTDKNHQPCLNNGRTAHWGLITGFILPFSPEKTSGYFDKKSTFSDRLGNLHYQLPPVAQLSLEVAEEELLVIAQQSKSRHQTIWPFSLLKASNRNLLRSKPLKLDGLLTSEFALENLRENAVFLWPASL